MIRFLFIDTTLTIKTTWMIRNTNFKSLFAAISTPRSTYKEAIGRSVIPTIPQDICKYVTTPTNS